MNSLVINFLVHGPVGRLEASSGEPKERPASRLHVALGRTDRSLLMVVRGRRQREFCAAFPQRPMSHRVPPWHLGNAAGRLVGLLGRWFCWPMGQQPCFFGCSPPLSLLLACQLCGLFGLPSRLFLLSARLFLGLLRGFRLGSLFSLDLGPGALSVALLFFAALFLELVAFGHSAHRIQARRQGLGSHPPLRQDLLATRLHGPHRHDPSHDDTLFSPPRALLG